VGTYKQEVLIEREDFRALKLLSLETNMHSTTHVQGVTPSLVKEELLIHVVSVSVNRICNVACTSNLETKIPVPVRMS
jgi:hypothetical protein